MGMYPITLIYHYIIIIILTRYSFYPLFNLIHSKRFYISPTEIGSLFHAFVLRLSSPYKEYSSENLILSAKPIPTITTRKITKTTTKLPPRLSSELFGGYVDLLSAAIWKRREYMVNLGGPLILFYAISFIILIIFSSLSSIVDFLNFSLHLMRCLTIPSAHPSKAVVSLLPSCDKGEPLPPKCGEKLARLFNDIAIALGNTATLTYVLILSEYIFLVSRSLYSLETKNMLLEPMYQLMKNCHRSEYVAIKSSLLSSPLSSPLLLSSCHSLF